MVEIILKAAGFIPKVMMGEERVIILIVEHIPRQEEPIILMPLGIIRNKILILMLGNQQHQRATTHLPDRQVAAPEVQVETSVVAEEVAAVAVAVEEAAAAVEEDNYFEQFIPVF